MSNGDDNPDPKTTEEPPHTERSIRDLLVDQVRRFVPSRCNVRATEAGTSSGGTSQSNAPKAQVPKCSTQNSEPNITVLHVRASVQRAPPAYHRPPDFSEQV